MNLKEFALEYGLHLVALTIMIALLLEVWVYRNGSDLNCQAFCTVQGLNVTYSDGIKCGCSDITGLEGFHRPPLLLNVTEFPAFNQPPG